jgi:hypothetical protein
MGKQFVEKAENYEWKFGNKFLHNTEHVKRKKREDNKDNDRY